MQVRTYVAPTKLEALLKIREELGADAVILGERIVRKGKLFSKKPMVEIQVGIRGTEATPELKPTAEATSKVEPKGIDTIDPTQTRLRKLEREIQEIRSLVQMLCEQQGATIPSPKAEPTERAITVAVDEHPLLRPLLSTGIEPDVARELLRRVPRIPQNAAIGALKQSLLAKIPIGGVMPRESRLRQVVALVGPTGVGKTTTIAKLAAIHSLDYNRKVALLSLDTYRIGAIQQLRSYAEIMNLPLHIATNADEVQEGLELFRGYDLVLIDTIGRGQRDEPHLQEMYHALMPAQPMVYLVLSATADTAVLDEAVQKFGVFAPEAMILTKTDEAVRFGNCINLCVRNPIPIAYFTTGQRVPEDICNADAQWLSCQIMRAVSECQVRPERGEALAV